MLLTTVCLTTPRTAEGLNLCECHVLEQQLSDTDHHSMQAAPCHLLLFSCSFDGQYVRIKHRIWPSTVKLLFSSICHLNIKVDLTM